MNAGVAESDRICSAFRVRLFFSFQALKNCRLGEEAVKKAKALSCLIGMVSAGLLCFSSSSNAASIRLLNDLCQSTNPTDQWVCTGYINGMIDAFFEIGIKNPDLQREAGGPMHAVTCMERLGPGTDDFRGLQGSQLFTDIRDGLLKAANDLKGGWMSGYPAAGVVSSYLSKRCASLTKTFHPESTKK